MLYTFIYLNVFFYKSIKFDKFSILRPSRHWESVCRRALGHGDNLKAAHSRTGIPSLSLCTRGVCELSTTDMIVKGGEGGTALVRFCSSQ